MKSAEKSNDRSGIISRLWEDVQAAVMSVRSHFLPQFQFLPMSDNIGSVPSPETQLVSWVLKVIVFLSAVLLPPKRMLKLDLF